MPGTIPANRLSNLSNRPIAVSFCACLSVLRPSSPGLEDSSGRAGERPLDFGEGPIEPGQERLDVAPLDRGPGPDPQTWGCGAMGGDVLGGILRIEQRRDRRRNGIALLGRERREVGIDDLE